MLSYRNRSRDPNLPGAALRLLTRKASPVLALLLLGHFVSFATEAPVPASISSGQIAPAPAAPNKKASEATGITYVGGQLTIHELDATLAQVLAKIATLTGMQIDFSEGANNEVMPIIQLGPGPARQVLASLLSDSNSDFLIQGSDKDPEKLQMVVVLPRNKKDGPDGNTTPSIRNSYGSAVARGGEQQNAPTAQADDQVAEAKTSDPQATPIQPEAAAQSPSAQRDQSSLSKASPLAPPDMAPDSINRQLQQMYQQRMQITQQDRQQVRPPAQP